MLKLLTMVAVMSVPTLAAAQTPPSAPPETTTPTEIRFRHARGGPGSAGADARRRRSSRSRRPSCKTLHPYVPNKAEQIFERHRHHPAGWPLAVASLLRERVFGRRLHPGRRPRQLCERLQLHRRARQLHDPGLQARRSRVRRAADVQPPRPICRCSAAGARQRRSASTASGRTPRTTIAPTISSSSRTARRSFTIFPTRRS